MRIRSFFLLALLLGWGPCLSADVLYSVTDLGRVSVSYTGRGGRLINNAGQVTGFFYTAAGDPHAFLYSNGQVIDLGPGGGRGINDAGQVVGGNFLYSNGQMLDLGAFGAMSINNAGQVKGDSMTAGNIHAFLYSNGQMTDLGTLPGDVYSHPTSINDAGQVVGISQSASFAQHAFLYSNGQMTDLGTLPGGDYSQAFSINNAGQVVGLSGGHAFLYSNGQMTDLGTLPGGFGSEAFSINNAGQVTGLAITRGDLHAFLYSNGQMLDLNDLIDPALGVTLNEGDGINDNGQIVARASSMSGPSHTYLLTPVPEPTTLSLFGAGLIVALLPLITRRFRCPDHHRP